MDFAGIVEETGEEIFGTARGTFAEYVSVSRSRIAPKPSSLEFAEASALPLAGVTALQGLRDPLPPLEVGVTETALRRNAERDDFVRARLQAGNQLQPILGQESHMIARAAAADALIHVPRGEGEIAAGARVSWLRL